MSRNNRNSLPQEMRVTNPFGGAPAPATSANQPSPFGAFGATQASPFAVAQASPFGATQPPPFGATQPSPFGGTQASPFGAVQTSTFGAFGASPSQSSNPFHQPQRLNLSMNQPPSKGGKGGKGKGGYQSAGQGGGGMQEDMPGSPKARVSNPFAAVGLVPKQALSQQEAVAQYKTEFLKKKGYPFSCLGPPDEPPVLTGDISPFELRWYLSQGHQDVRNAIGDRSNLLNEDFSEFLRGATSDGVLPIQIHRAGPYRIPEADYPSFVPRSHFPLISKPDGQLSPSELEVYRARDIAAGVSVPLLPPPIELR